MMCAFWIDKSQKWDEAPLFLSKLSELFNQIQGYIYIPREEQSCHCKLGRINQVPGLNNWKFDEYFC